VLDAHTVIKDPGTPTSINPIYDAGDGFHINAAANASLLAQMVADGQV